MGKCTGGSSGSRLHFGILSCDGGQYGPTYDESNVLVNDGSVYCSMKKRNVNILFSYLSNDPRASNAHCLLQSIFIKAPTSGFTAPCRNMLVFASSHPIDPASTTFFDNFSRSKYRNYLETLESNVNATSVTGSTKCTPQKLQPVSFIRLSMSNQYQHEWRHDGLGCKYVMVKLLNGESDSNIDLEYVEFKGSAGKSCFYSSQIL